MQTFTLNSHSFTALDPNSFKVEVSLSEKTKALFHAEQPDVLKLPRPMYAERYEAWSRTFEGSMREVMVTLSAILVPAEGSPDITEEFIGQCDRFEVGEVLSFFTIQRTEGYSKKLRSLTNGMTTETPTETPSTTRTTSRRSTKRVSE